MDIFVDTKFPFKESSSKYSYNWSFAGKNLEEVLTFHDLINRPLISETIIFKDGVLSLKPHRLKFFIQNQQVFIHLCINEISIINNSDEFSHCKILNIKAVTRFCQHGVEKCYTYCVLKNELARSKIKELIERRPLSSQDFLKPSFGDTEYLLDGCYITAPHNKGGSVFHNVNNYVQYYRRSLTDISFEIEISCLFWNNSQPKQKNVVDEIKIRTPKSSKADNHKDTGILIMHTAQYFLSNKFTDFIIKSNEKEFPVHRIILGNKSSALEKLFLEMGDDRLLKINSSASVVEEFLRFVYTGEVNKIKEIAYDLFLISNEYKVEDLKRLCENALVNSVNEENFTELIKQGKWINSEMLVNRCYEEFKKKVMHQNTKGEDITSITQEHPDLLLRMLREKNKSSAFEKLFLEMGDDRLLRINFNASVFEEFLRFMYTGEVNKIKEMAYDLFLISDEYKLKDLKRVCESALVDSINAKNFTKLYKQGKSINSEKVVNRCYEEFKKKVMHQNTKGDDVTSIMQEFPDLFLRMLREKNN